MRILDRRLSRKGWTASTTHRRWWLQSCFHCMTRRCNRLLDSANERSTFERDMPCVGHLLDRSHFLRLLISLDDHQRLVRLRTFQERCRTRKHIESEVFQFRLSTNRCDWIAFRERSSEMKHNESFISRWRRFSYAAGRISARSGTSSMEIDCEDFRERNRGLSSSSLEEKSFRRGVRLEWNKERTLRLCVETTDRRRTWREIKDLYWWSSFRSSVRQVKATGDRPVRL